MEASEGDPVVVNACEAYAGPLYSYSLWLLADEERAITALVELFVGAQRLGVRLSDPRLSRWLLYAMVRPGCLRERGEQDRPWPAGVADSFGWSDGLEWPEREMLELSVRHGLDEQDVSLVVGVSRDDVRRRLADARASLEAARAVRTLIPPDCDELTGQLAASSPSESGAVVQRHAAACPVCGERLRDATPLPTRLEQVATPPTLRPRILRELADNYAALVEPVAKALGQSVLPMLQPELEQPLPVRGRRRRAMVTAAVVIVPFGVATLLLTGGGNGNRPSAEPVMTGAGANASGTSPASAYGGSTAASSGVAFQPGAAPSHGGATTSATSSPTAAMSAKTVPTGTGPSSGSPAPTGAMPSPTPSAASSTGPSLGVSWTQGSQTTTITLTATGDSPVQWSVSVSDDYLSVDQSSGTLTPGQSLTVTVTVDPSLAPKGPWHAKIFVDPGSTVIPVNSGKGHA